MKTKDTGNKVQLTLSHAEAMALFNFLEGLRTAKPPEKPLIALHLEHSLHKWLSK